MTEPSTPTDAAKSAAAARAAALVEPGMRVGLGTGSTAAWLVRHLGARVRDEGLRLTAVATSRRTAELAREVGIAVVDLDAAGWLDLTIDGTDEIDGEFRLIKGGGGALLHEKIVAGASDRMVVIADASKRVGTLGAFPLPVEVVPFGWQVTQGLIREAIGGLDVDGDEVVLRQSGDETFGTDEGNVILDCHLGRIGNPRQVSLALTQIPGVVETGLFLGLCDALVIGHPDGSAEMHEAEDGGGTENLFADGAE